MEKRPFDGVAFSFDFRIYDLFDTSLYPEKIFQFDDLKQIQWKTFTDNFIRVRAQSKNGPEWLNDKAWNNIIANVRNISRAISISGSQGIFLDPEYYYYESLPDKDPWIYNSRIYPGKSYQEVGKAVEQRGEQFMGAFQSYKPDIKILNFYMMSLVTLQARQKAIDSTGMALYPFFIKGMLAGKNSSSLLIDGNELGFSYQTASQFVLSGSEIKEWGIDAMPVSLKSVYQKVAVSQPVFYDLIYGTFPQWDKGYSKNQKDNWLWENLYMAIKSSDEYVWFYNSKINWWTGKLDKSIPEIIKNVRNTCEIEYNKPGPDLKGSGYLFNVLSDKFTNENVFSYEYDNKTKLISVHLISDSIESLQVFENSSRIYSFENPSKDIQLILNKYAGKGNLILIAKDKKKGYAVAYIN